MKRRAYAKWILSIVGASASAFLVSLLLNEYDVGIVGRVIYIIISMIIPVMFVFGYMDGAKSMGRAITLGILGVLLGLCVSFMLVYILQIIVEIIGFVIGLDKYDIGLVFVIPIAFVIFLLYTL